MTLNRNKNKITIHPSIGMRKIVLGFRQVKLFTLRNESAQVTVSCTT